MKTTFSSKEIIKILVDSMRIKGRDIDVYPKWNIDTHTKEVELELDVIEK